MLSSITRRALRHTLVSSVFGRSAISKTFTTGNIYHGCDKQFDKGMPSSKKLEPTNKIYDEAQRQKILSDLKESNRQLEAQNELLRLQIEKIDALQKDADFKMVYCVYKNFRQMVRDDAGPYLSLKIEDFSSTPSQELKSYWSDKSLGQLTEKLNEHKANQQLREVFEREKMPFDKLLAACEGLVEWARIRTEGTGLDTTSRIF